MTKFLRKIGAVVLALSLVMAMSVSAFAVQLPASGNTGTLATTDNTVEIKTAIRIHGSLSKVYGPNVTYTYSIAPATVPSGADVTDANGIKSVITAGPAAAVSLLNNGEVVYTTAEVDASQAGVELIPDSGHELKVNVDPTKFTKPGVYRYLITDETTDATLYAAGITRPDDYNTQRFLDVYVRNAQAGGFEVFGYVLAEQNIKNITTETSKTQGFVSDDYYTVDVDLTKDVTGAMGDINHEFPFDVVITNNGLQYYAKENAAATIDDDQEATRLSFTISLKDGDVYYLAGLNPKATVAFTEHNDTADTYVVTVTSGSDKPVDEENIAPLTGTKASGTLVVSNYNADNSNSTVAATVTPDHVHTLFENNLEEISPTGVVLRIAPYALALTAGVLLFVLSKKRRYGEEM